MVWIDNKIKLILKINNNKNNKNLLKILKTY